MKLSEERIKELRESLEDESYMNNAIGVMASNIINGKPLFRHSRGGKGMTITELNVLGICKYCKKYLHNKKSKKPHQCLTYKCSVFEAEKCYKTKPVRKDKEGTNV